ncbi:MAG: response regulator transcription factor [Myxococcota bacterium]
MSKRILLIEDDPDIAGQLVEQLHRAGFRVLLSVHGRAGMRHALSAQYDLMLLDVMLPGGDGFEILRAVRERSAVPVIVLTARTGVDDRVRAFALGADDYLPKPFYFEELKMRIGARLSRVPAEEERGVRFANVEVDFDGQRALLDGKDVGLTRVEFLLLRWMVERPDRPLTRAQLINGPLRGEGRVQERTVDSHIAHIRRKLGAQASAHLKTVFRIGYRFEPQPSGSGS